jgi:uncharacterized protein (DUF885 family)
LQAICDCLAGLALHGRGGSYEAAVSAYERDGYVSREVAGRRVRRVVLDARVSFTALGEWGILDLRAQIREGKPAGFPWRDFHDRLATYGQAPISLVRDDWREDGRQDSR